MGYKCQSHISKVSLKMFFCASVRITKSSSKQLDQTKMLNSWTRLVTFLGHILRMTDDLTCDCIHYITGEMRQDQGNVRTPTLHFYERCNHTSQLTSFKRALKKTWRVYSKWYLIMVTFLTIVYDNNFFRYPSAQSNATLFACILNSLWCSCNWPTVD